MRTLSLGLLALAALPAPLRAQEPDALDRVRALQEELQRLEADLGGLRDALAGRRGGEWSSAERRFAGWEEFVQARDHALLADVPWQFLGPTNISGRVVDVAAVTPRGDSYTLFAATATGGVWRSRNEGVTWEPCPLDAPTTSIGDVTLAPSDPRIVYVGTGEANIFRSSMAGIGVFRSDDGGDTWRHLGLSETHTIARIVVHPSDPDTLWVAASGHEWEDDPHRGVWRSRDGGATWEHVLFVDPGAGAIDLVGDPTKPEILYAAFWERRRELWNDPRNTPHTQHSGIWRSTDGGDTWQPLENGLPEPKYRGRIGIDLARSNPSRLYAFVDHYEEIVPEEGAVDSYGRPKEAGIRGATIYRSDDRGDTWTAAERADEDFMRGLGATYGWVFGQIRVDPTDEDTIYVMGLGLNVSHDGGKSFQPLRGMHGDHHALWIDPANPRYLVNGNDGGLAVSYDGGEAWRTTYDTLPAVQFYNIAFDMDAPFHVYGSIQDHGSRRATVDLSRGRRVRPQEWEWAPGGEASYHQVDPTDPDTVYAESFYGSIYRMHMAEREYVALEQPEADELRGQWLAPFLISPHNPRIVYHGRNRVLRSMDRGERFEAISPDLTSDDPDRLGDIPYQTVTTLSESPLVFGYLYAGTDEGHLHVTRDGGATWTAIADGLEPHRWISRVAASRFDRDTVYVAQNGKRNGDFAPYLWRSRDGGRTWRSLAKGLPLGPLNVVLEDTRDPETLYVGSDVGVHVSRDGGATWRVLGGGLPTAYVHDLALHPREDVLLAATYGRGVWLLDLVGLRPQPAAEPDAGAAPAGGDDEEEEDDDRG